MSDPIDRPFLQPLEPTAQQEGVDVPGFYSATTDFINFGVYNGNFRVGPPDATANLDVATSLAGSNFLPGWRWVQSSNTLTAKLVTNAGAASGSNLRITSVTPGAQGQAFLEQVVDISGSANGDLGYFLRATAKQSAAGEFQLQVRSQYLAADGSITGMPPERSYPFTPSTTSILSTDAASEVNPAPATARYLRIRLVAIATSTSAGDTLDIFDVRRERSLVNLRLPDASRTTNGLYDVQMQGSNLLWQPASTTIGDPTTGKRLLNYQLVAIPYSLVNIPAGATTELQLWGDTALALGIPRIGSPWPGAIVGASYRLSAAPSGGTLNFHVTVGGTRVWNPFALLSGSPAADDNNQAVGIDEFGIGQQLGVEVVASGAYAPTTADCAFLLWLAIKYDGE